MATRNIWRSKRLIFRPVEQSDEAFLLSLNQDTSQGFQNATHRLPVPQGSASAAAHREKLQKALLGCLICLPPPATLDAVPSATTSDNVPMQPIPIGTIALTPTELNQFHHRNTSIGLTISVPYQSQGYGSEAILWVLEWAFRHANMHRVEIGAFAWNEGAWKLYERLGFVHEGRKREVAWYDGKYRDGIEMAMLVHEWEEKYGNKLQNGSD